MAPWPPAAHNMASSFSANLGLMTQQSYYMHVSILSSPSAHAVRSSSSDVACVTLGSYCKDVGL